MGYDSDEDSRDEDEDDGGRFMFGNVDNSSDLDVDYLDEDAKEHFAALTDKLGPSLTDIEVCTYNCVFELDIIADKDHVKTILNNMIFERGEFLDVAPKSTNEPAKFDTYDTQAVLVDITDSPVHRSEVMKELPVDDKLSVLNSLPLPVLCVEDGRAILKFSEVFCIHEPPKKVEKRSRRYPIPKDRYVEEDEEIFFKSSFQGYSGVKLVNVVVSDSVTYFPSEGFGSVKFSEAGGFSKMHANAECDSCLSGQPLTEDGDASLAERLPSPTFYPFEPQSYAASLSSY